MQMNSLLEIENKISRSHYDLDEMYAFPEYLTIPDKIGLFDSQFPNYQTENTLPFSLLKENQEINPLKSENIFFLSYIPNVLIPQNQKIDTNDTKTYEQINQEKILFLNAKITPLLISLIKNEDFEFGQNSESIRLVDREIKENEFATKEWFNCLFNHYFGSDKETNILIGLLHIVEFLSESFNPNGKTMALAALSHRSNEVKELGVRILESSCTVENLNILKNVQTDIKWLQEYINQVITDFELILCPS
jgi:hypothetical protein